MSKKKTQKKKEPAAEAGRFFVLHDSGKEFKIIGEQGKFWICEGGHTFHKGRNRGYVKVVEDQKEDSTPNEEDEIVPADVEEKVEE